MRYQVIRTPDTKRMAGKLYIDNIEDVLRNLKDPTQLERLHGRLAAKISERKNAVSYLAYLKERYGLELGTPPIKGSKHIQPIISAQELLQESRDMQNCLFSYAESMLRGEKNSHIYRITSPERGTVEIDIEGGIPKIKQLKLIKNTKPSEQTTIEVNEWLNRYLENIVKGA